MGTTRAHYRGRSGGETREKWRNSVRVLRSWRQPVLADVVTAALSAFTAVIVVRCATTATDKIANNAIAWVVAFLFFLVVM